MGNDNAAGTQPASGTKAPLVKRIKVPTVRKGTPPVQPAQQAPAAANPPAEDMNDPSVQLEAQYPQGKEPALPPEEKPAAPAEEQKPTARKRNRNETPPPPKKSLLPELGEKEKKQLKKLRLKAKSILSGIVVRLLIFVVLLIIICAGVYSALPLIAEKKLPDLFAANGMPFQKFKLTQLTIDTMELTNVSDKANKMSISKMTFNYSLLGLYTSNTIKSLEISGVTLDGEKKDDGISLGVLDDFIRSPINDKKGTSLTIGSLSINNGTFRMNNASSSARPVVDENGEAVDDTLYIKFNATGTLNKAGLDLKVSTDYETPQVVLKTETNLNKTALFSKIKTQITDGNVMKNGEKVGSVTGNLEIAVDKGVLSTGTADLLILSSSQKLRLNASILPKGSSFDFSLDLDRSFDNPKDAAGKFVGLLSMKANDVTATGTFQQFKGKLPLRMKAPVLTNGTTSIRDMNTEMDVVFSCAGMNCTVNLTKPMKFSFSSMQTTAMLRRVTFFTPLELTINPDSQKEPFLKLENSILSFILPMEGFKTQLQIADNQTSSQMAVALNGLKSRIKYNVFSGGYAGDAVFSNSGYLDKNIRITGIQGITSFNSNSFPEARMRFANASLVKPNVFPDFSADFRFRPQNGYDLGIDSTLQVQNGLVQVSINGSYSLASHEADLYIVVPKFILADTGAKLSTVMPFMLSYLPDTTVGAIAVKGRVAIKNDVVQGPLSILMEKVYTSWKNVQFDNINGVLTLSSIYPLETPSNQQLFAGTMNVGIPFQNALFNFQVRADKGIEVANARMKYADGQFKTIKSFLIPFDGKPSQIILEGNAINLSMITNNLKSSALQMDGILNSEWRLSLTESRDLVIDQAVFSTKMPGTLHFTPPKEMQGKMNSQMQSFLKDVIIKSMKVTAKGQMDGPVSFDVAITGHSPLDETGNDQDVSFDFKSNLKSLLKQDERGFVDIPPDIMQAMQSYAK